MASILHNGQHYPVTQAWWDVWCAERPELARMTKGELDAERTSLKNSPTFTEADRPMLWTLDEHWNVRNAIDVHGLKSAEEDPFALVGVDQFQGGWRRAICGCFPAVAHDHNLHMAIVTAQDAVEAAEELAGLAPDAPEIVQRLAQAKAAKTQARADKHATIARLTASTAEIAVMEKGVSSQPPLYVCEVHAGFAGTPDEFNAKVAADEAAVLAWQAQTGG